MIKKVNLILVLFFFTANLFAAGTWDLLDKAMSAWNVNGGSDTNKAWTSSQKGSGITITQEAAYVNILKTGVATGNNYAFLVPPALTLSVNTAYSIAVRARTRAIDKTTYPDSESFYESNQISARLNGRNLSLFMKYGAENEGYVSLGAAVDPAGIDRYMINTSEWHVYRFVLHADNMFYDVYVDDIEEAVFENIPTSSMSGSNIVRLGAESTHRCNMDIEYVKMGTGDFYSKPKIVSLTLSSDSHVENHERKITVAVNTVLIDDQQKLLISLVDDQGKAIGGEVEAIVAQNQAVTDFTIPASVPRGRYFVRVAAPEGKIGDVAIPDKMALYVVVEPSPLTSNLLPNVSPVGFVIDINDYVYKAPSGEFIFPAIIDTKPYTQDGKFLNGQDTLARYYRYYTPHENPGGMFLATAPTLDGPWTERNTVIDLDWAKAVEGSIVNTATHISACQVIWNDVYHRYFMYFHGPNTTTHYATSDDLVDWTFGGSILNAQSFGSRGSEASYAKVFEYKLPDVDNKYILMLMIAESSSSRKIYWAHSKDGIDWTCAGTPLISPDLDYKKIPGTDIKPDYVGGIGNNVAGPFFMRSGDRNFVFFNGSSGNICVAEVGDSFDMEVHWGEYMKASDVVIDTDEQGNPIAVPRIAAPVFITDDAGKWYMFFEAGSRLGANVALAKEQSPVSLVENPADDDSISLSGNLVNTGQHLSVSVKNNIPLSEVVLYDITGSVIFSEKTSGDALALHAPAVAGLYVLAVKQDDHRSKEFKILVK